MNAEEVVGYQVWLEARRMETEGLREEAADDLFAPPEPDVDSIPVYVVYEYGDAEIAGGRLFGYYEAVGHSGGGPVKEPTLYCAVSYSRLRANETVLDLVFSPLTDKVI